MPVIPQHLGSKGKKYSRFIFGRTSLGYMKPSFKQTKQNCCLNIEEAEVVELQVQGHSSLYNELEASLGSLARPCLKNLETKQKKLSHFVE